MKAVTSGASVAVEGVPPAPAMAPLTAATETPNASAFAVAMSVALSAMSPLTETVPEPSDARADASVPFEQASAADMLPPFFKPSAVDEAAARAMPMPAASADDLACRRSVEMYVTDRLGAVVTLP